MIAEYVYDALAGEDRDYAAPLMRRKAPFSPALIKSMTAQAGVSKREFYKALNKEKPPTD